MYRMSLPVTAPLMMMGPVSPFDALLHIFNSNPYFVGIMMLLLNVGGRFIGLEITKKQEQFLQHPWVRRVIIFTAIFVATRNLWVAFWTTLIVVFLLGYLFNENSALCIFGQGGTHGATCSQGTANKINNTVNSKDELTPEEREILQRLHAKSLRYATSNQKTGDGLGNDMEETVLLSDIYSANMSLLRK